MLARVLRWTLQIATVATVIIALLEYVRPSAPRIPTEPLPVVIVDAQPAAGELTVTAEADPSTVRPPDLPSEQSSPKLIGGRWWLPLARKNMYIDCAEACTGAALVYEERAGGREPVGIAQVEGDLVRIHMRIMKRDGLEQQTRNAYLSLHLSEDGRQLRGDFRGDDKREYGMVTWIRG